MRIWIDGYEANVSQRLGSSKVAFELLRNIERVDKKNDYTILLPSTPSPDLPKARPGWSYKLLKPKQFWTRVALPIALFTAQKKPDLIFSPTHYIPRFSPVKRIGMIFDLSYLHFASMFKKRDLLQLKEWSGYSIKHADHIITISNFSKADIIKNYHIPDSKISVAYPGYSSTVYHPVQDKQAIERVKISYHIEGNYLIYIGTIQPRKNLLRLIETFKSINDVKLVIVGKTTGLGRQGWKFDEVLKRPQELGIKDKVIFTGFVEDNSLNYLLNGSIALVLPSLYEGFGIPVVDAMACGKPVLVSNVSSLPEISDGAGISFDPYSVEEIEKAIKQIVGNKQLRIKLGKEGLKKSKSYSWQRMAEQVLETFDKVVSV